MQVHVFLPAGRIHLDRWFPGFTEDCIAEGAAWAPGFDLSSALSAQYRSLRGDRLARPCRAAGCSWRR
jgi:hypothetical protein